MATQKQIAFISDLFGSRQVRLQPGQTIEQLKEQAATLSIEQASAWIDRLLTLPKIRQGNGGGAKVEPEAGMYRRGDGEIFRVYLGQQSGRMLMKQVVRDDEGYSYEYIGAAAYRMTGLQRLSLDEAKKWGKMTGHCCVCARRLDVPESVEAGIGPVCAGRVGA